MFYKWNSLINIFDDDLFCSDTEARAASLEEKAMSLDVALREANQRIQQLESNQHAQ